MDEGEKLGGCREQDSIYGNEIEANKSKIRGMYKYGGHRY